MTATTNATTWSGDVCSSGRNAKVSTAPIGSQINTSTIPQAGIADNGWLIGCSGHSTWNDSSPRQDPNSQSYGDPISIVCRISVHTM